MHSEKTTDDTAAGRRARLLVLGAALTATVALGLVGCSSGTGSTASETQPSVTSSSSAAVDDDDDDDDDPADSGLSIATSSLDCTGPAGGIQTIAVFATEEEAKSRYDAQTVVKTEASTSYLLGGNWAMVADASSMNAAQTLGVRDQTIVMN